MMASELKCRVDLESPIAVYVQIENQIRFALASGRLKGGETLPSVREMSTMLDVNPNTVTKAYRDLELLGLVRTRRGVGVRATEDAARLTRDTTRRMARAHLANAVAECTASGLTPAEIRKVVTATMDRNAAPYTPGNSK